MRYSNFTFHSHHKHYTPAFKFALVFLSVWARLDLLLFLQIWFFPLNARASLSKTLSRKAFGFRRHKTGMVRKVGVIVPCNGMVRHLQGPRNSRKPCRCHFKQLSSAKLGPREAQEEKSPNGTANHKKPLLGVESHTRWGKFISGICSQTVKLSQIRPEPGFYFQPTDWYEVSRLHLSQGRGKWGPRGSEGEGSGGKLVGL